MHPDISTHVGVLKALEQTRESRRQLGINLRKTTYRLDAVAKEYKGRTKEIPQHLREEVVGLFQEQRRLKDRIAAEVLLSLPPAKRLPGLHQSHGMPKPEVFHEMVLSGVSYRFNLEDRDSTYAAMDTIAALFERANGDIPEPVRRQAKVLIFTSSRNKDDAYWESVYSHKSESGGFRSAATGGMGEIVVYNGDPMTIGVYAHEAGHLYAESVFGTTTPTGAYMDAVRSAEPPVSDYAKNSPSEDFAESVKIYAVDRVTLRENHPLRYAALKSLLGE